MRNGKTGAPAGPVKGGETANNGGNGDGEEAVYVNIPLAAHMLGREPGEIARLVEIGQIESVTAGEARLVPVSAIRRYLAELRR